MNIPNETRLDLLIKMCDLAKEIVRITSLLELTGEEDRVEEEINNYALLMNDREPLIKEMTAIKQKIDTCKPDGENVSCEAEQKALDKLIVDIITLDKKQSKMMQHIKASVKASLKDLKDGQKLNNAYMYTTDDLYAGVIDTKK